MSPGFAILSKESEKMDFAPDQYLYFTQPG